MKKLLLFALTLILTNFAFDLNLLGGQPADTIVNTVAGQVSEIEIEEDEILKLFFIYPQKVLKNRPPLVTIEQLKNFSPDQVQSLKLIESIKRECNQLNQEQNQFIENFYNNTIHAQNILYLGDYPRQGGSGLSLQTAPLLTKTQVYLTDLDCVNDDNPSELEKFFSLNQQLKNYFERYQNLHLKKVDHTKDLPFADSRFDAILMQAGLCFCSAKYDYKDGILQSYHQKTCGGLAPTLSSYLHFLREITRVLNKNNPASLALLEGLEYQGEKIDENGKPINNPALWKAAAQALVSENKFKIRVELLFLVAKNIRSGKNDRLFKGVRIKML